MPLRVAGLERVLSKLLRQRSLAATEDLADAGVVQSDHLADLAQGHSGLLGSFKTFAARAARLLALGLGPLEGGLSSAQVGAGPLLVASCHEVQTIPREPVASVAVDTVKAWPTRPSPPAQK